MSSFWISILATSGIAGALASVITAMFTGRLERHRLATTRRDDWLREQRRVMADLIDCLGQYAQAIGNFSIAVIMLSAGEAVDKPEAAAHGEAARTLERSIARARLVVTDPVLRKFVEIVVETKRIAVTEMGRTMNIEPASTRPAKPAEETRAFLGAVLTLEKQVDQLAETANARLAPSIDQDSGSNAKLRGILRRLTTRKN